MNCHDFQEQIFEYVEGSLGPMASAATAEHLADCRQCRELLARNQDLDRALFRMCREDSESFTLRPETRRRILAAVGDQASSGSRFHHLREWWNRWAWPASIATSLLVAAFLIIGFPLGSRHTPTRQASPPAPHIPVLLQLSLCTPIYTFEEEDNQVTDSLNCNPTHVQQTVWFSQAVRAIDSKQKSKARL